jgi:MGT family glycosyltransferase
MMEIAIGLRAEGHRVVLQTLSSEKDIIVDEGIEHRSISHKIETLSLEDYKINNPIKQVKNTFECWLARAQHEIEDLNQSYVEFSPDLLIVDVNTWGASAFAEAQRKPWIMFMPYCLSVPSPDTPAFGPGFAPPRNGLDRLRDRIVRGVMNAAFKGIVKQLDNFRKELGVQPLGAYENLFSKPDLLLYLTAEPFEYPRAEWPSNLRSIGPGLWAPPSEAPEWIDELPHPRVLVSVSTERQNDGKIIKTAIEALSNEKGSVIITTAALDPEQFVASHDRMRIIRFLPHSSVIPKVDVVITHGGMGTTQRALAAGVPVCVIPWGRDQNETARRAENCGAGIMIPKNKLNPERLLSAVHEAQTRKSEAEKVASAFVNAGGAKRGVELINSLLKTIDKQNLIEQLN